MTRTSLVYLCVHLIIPKAPSVVVKISKLIFIFELECFCVINHVSLTILPLFFDLTFKSPCQAIKGMIFCVVGICGNRKINASILFYSSRILFTKCLWDLSKGGMRQFRYSTIFGVGSPVICDKLLIAS